MWPILKEAAGDILRYVIQMLPCALAGAGLFFALLPLRRRRLARRGLRSPATREGALLVFVLFCAGLAALTVFPSNLWSYVLEPGRWPEGTTFWSFYPTAPAPPGGAAPSADPLSGRCRLSFSQLLERLSFPGKYRDVPAHRLFHRPPLAAG